MDGKTQSPVPTDRLKVYAHIFHGKDVDVYRRNYEAGREPDETPYGFHLAEQEGFDVTFSRDARSGRFLARLIRKIIGFDLVHAFSNRSRIRDADVIWVMTEGEAFAIALLFKLGLAPRRPIVANSVWILNNWNRTHPLKRRLFRALAPYLSILTVHSRECLAIADKAFPDLRTGIMYFGINTDLFVLTPPKAAAGGAVKLFAPGNDKTRDWDTLLDAFGNDDRFELTIICSWLSDERAAAYRNVRMVRDPTMADFLRCYEDADLVAIPMKENLFSGITVALEAVAVGKPVLSTLTGGVPTYFEPSEVFYVPANDPEAMRRTALEASTAARLEKAINAQAKFKARDYSTRALIKRYADLTRSLLGTA